MKRPPGTQLLRVLEVLDKGPATLTEIKKHFPDMGRTDVYIYLKRAVAQGYATKSADVYRVKSFWKELAQMPYGDRQKLKPKPKSMINSVFELGKYC